MNLKVKRAVVLSMLLTVSHIGCGDDSPDDPSEESGTDATDPEGTLGEGDTDGDGDAGGDTVGDSDGDVDTDTGSGDAPFSLEWTFDDGWDGFEHAYGDFEFTHNPEAGTLELDAEFSGPGEESSFGQELWAANWTGASAIDIRLRTLEHTTGSWRFEFRSGYSHTPCITNADHPDTTDWTTVTFDLFEVCDKEDIMVDMAQMLIVGVITGSDATGPETVRVAVDSITVR